MKEKVKTNGIINSLELDLYLKNKSIFHLADSSLSQKTTSSTGKQAITDFDNWKVNIKEIINLNKIDKSSSIKATQTTC